MTLTCPLTAELGLREVGEYEVKGSSVPQRVFGLVWRAGWRDRVEAAGARGGALHHSVSTPRTFRRVRLLRSSSAASVRRECPPSSRGWPSAFSHQGRGVVPTRVGQASNAKGSLVQALVSRPVTVGVVRGELHRIGIVHHLLSESSSTPEPRRGAHTRRWRPSSGPALSSEQRGCGYPPARPRAWEALRSSAMARISVAAHAFTGARIRGS
jgi:hypothetical protein